jgi:hypothetical protein
LRIPLALAAGMRSVWFKSDLRVFVAKDVGARVLLLADLAGHSFVKEFPYETASGVEPAEGGGEHVFQIVHEAQIVPAGGYAFSMLILVERLAGDKLATVFLDSLDIEVNPDLKAVASVSLEATSPPSSPPDAAPDSLPDSPPDGAPDSPPDSPPNSPPETQPDDQPGSPPSSPPDNSPDDPADSPPDSPPGDTPHGSPPDDPPGSPPDISPGSPPDGAPVSSPPGGDGQPSSPPTRRPVIRLPRG